MSAYIPVAPDRWAEMVQASADVGPLRNKVSDLSTQLELRQVEIDRLRAEIDRFHHTPARLSASAHSATASLASSITRPMGMKPWICRSKLNSVARTPDSLSRCA